MNQPWRREIESLDEPTMAKRGFCYISTSSRGVSRWLNVGTCLQSVFVMLYLVMFMHCDGNEHIDGVDNHLLYDGCENFGHFDRTVENKASLPAYYELKNVCFQSPSLFFPSTLIGLGTSGDVLPKEDTNFHMDNFGSCERPSSLDLNSVVFSSESLSLPYVEISPRMLDWGANGLFTPSLVHLTVSNTHNSSILHVYEPFSSDGQFYAYGFEKMSLSPGEAGSIAFVFLPKRLGSVLAHVVLQTSFGGFVIHARGIAVESPYGLEPFRGFEHLSDGRLSWNLSLYNSFDAALYVEEVTAKMLIYSEDTSQARQLICCIKPYQNYIGHFRSFCKSGEREVPWMEIRPHKHWEVPPHDAEVVMKVKLWPPVKGNISGVICLKLQNSAHDNFKTIMLPLEAKVDGKANYNSPTGAISLFFEPLVPCDGKGFVCTLSVRNSASHLLTIVSIAENFNVFEVRYLEGLLLYPDTITHVALISYSHPDVSEHIPTKFPWSSPGCKLSLLTNETTSPKIEISCEALVQTCCNHGVESGFIPHESSFLGMKAQKDKKLMNARTGSLGSILEESFPPESKFLGLLEADRRILENWRSQGTMAKLSVLKDHELLFPVVQIGTQYSKWITVHNPSQKPVVMQLVLNSGAIIDHCKYPDDSFKPSFKLISVESQDGFSMPETTTTEVILHPLGSAQIGPILFRPSKRCTWRSSALIRNNLSGVEWLPLQAFGGSHSLLLLEGSEAVNKIEFNLNLQSVLNASSSGLSLHMESRKKLCIHQLYKELYAKNAGELPVKVTRLEVSGIECGSDGFIIHNCKGFSLAPGESARLLISYQAYFSAAPLKRHLKLTTDTGFLVIPLEASHPVNLTDQCKKSLFWALIWKLPALVFTIVVIVCLLFFIRHAVASARKDYSIKSENTIAISMAEKSRVHRNARNFRPIKKNDKLDEGLAIDRYSRCENSALENTQKVKDRKDSEYQKKPALQSPPPTKIHIGTLDSSGETELPQSGNLTVKVVKERGRRRKRRTGGGLASKLEVSSSQSGNSTPSSPLSPDSFTPNSSFSSFGALVEEHSHEKKPDFSLAIKQTAPEPQRSIGRPVLLPSATFPGTSCRASGITTKLLASSSPLAPHARAPGSKLNNEKGRKTEEDEAYGKQYTYDIWGNHLCAHLMGKSKEITSKVFDASESDSQSFFTRDPQSLMMMSSAHSETPGHNLTPFDVDYLHQIK